MNHKTSTHSSLAIISYRQLTPSHPLGNQTDGTVVSVCVGVCGEDRVAERANWNDMSERTECNGWQMAWSVYGVVMGGGGGGIGINYT